MEKQNDKITLWKITEEIDALESLLEMDGGEINEEYEQLEKEVELQLGAKIDSYVGLLKMLKHEVIGVKQEIKELQSYCKVKENKIARIEFIMKQCLNKSKDKKFSGIKNEIKLRKPLKKLLITDESKIPMEYIQTETITKVDSAQLKKDLKESKIDGCELINGEAGLIIGLKK